MDQKWLADRMTARLNRKDGGSETAALEWAWKMERFMRRCRPGRLERHRIRGFCSGTRLRRSRRRWVLCGSP